MSGIKYHPSTPYEYQDLCYLSFSCIMTLVSLGAGGGLMKSEFPSNAISADIFDFDIEYLNRFNLIWDCLMRWKHRCIGKIFSSLLCPAMKWGFHIWMAWSAEFLLCMWGETNFNTTDCWQSKFLSASDDFLSRQCVAGLKPLFSSSSWTFL